METPQTLERSVLERKERDELQAIASALGVKPGSRARKADIVDLILQHTGVIEAPTGEPAPSAAPSDEAAVDVAPAGATSEPAAAPAIPPNGSATGGRRIASSGRARKPRADVPADEAAGGAPEVAAERPPHLDEPPADWELSGTAGAHADAAAGAGEAPPVPDASADRPRRADRADRPERGDRQARGGGQERGDGQARAEGQVPADRGERADGQAGGGGREAEATTDADRPEVDAEPGNRRRRRRGRDRDRDRDRHGDRPDARPDEPFTGEPVEVAGMLDLRDEGYGFLRVKGYLPSKDDVYVSVKQARQFGLRKGDHVTGAGRPATRNEKNPALLRIDTVNDGDPETARNRPRFEDLTPLFPDQKLELEDPADPTNMTARIIDLIAPIGKGQRGLIVSPPKAGKTTIMKQIARSIETNNPDVHLMVLLVDERPEEVTDMRRWVRGEVVASTFDRPSDEHTHVAELAIERAKRLVESGRDVVIILDGITRLARAYNLAAPATGRIMSGGIDTGALYPPKKFFGAARNIEEGGSLTILATALVETGSRMDEVIFEEFKGTGNMELRLDRKLAERRIYPAIDVDASSTRHEELLFPRNQLQQVWKLRRVLSGLGEGGSAAAGLELLIDRMKTFRSNEEFLAEVAKAPSVA
ncbi:MAG: transcription termination factor Rho [Acidimicrobiales bacterium]|nr:transcription termination factor Rho [Acidimicrobiales bacterium]